MPRSEDRTSFEVTQSRSDTHVVVRVDGELDAAAAPRMRSELAAAVEEDRPVVVVDLHAVTFVDAAGIGTLVNAARKAAERGGRLTVASPLATVRRVLEMTQVDKRLGVHTTVHEALA